MVSHHAISRLRLLILCVLIALLVISPAIHFGGGYVVPGPVAADEGENDGNNGEDDEGNNGRGNGNEGNKGKDKDKDKDKEKKKDKDNDDDEVNPIPLAQLYLVAVACQYQSGVNATTCLFVGGTEFGIGDVTRVSIPEGMACTEVTGGTFATLAVDGLGQALASPDGAPAATVVFAGRVRTNGEASYRVTTPNGLFPAKGPGLQCGEATQPAAPAELSATTGAVRVIAYDCPAGTNADTTTDWYAACTTPSVGVTFRLLQNGVSSDAAKTGTTDESGSLTFPNLPAGTFHLTEDDGNWCHAESDNVDAQGDVVVSANERSTVWIFHCPTPSAS